MADQHGTAQLPIVASSLVITRRRFDPFGNLRGTPAVWPTALGYVNGIVDETGLMHLGTRGYDAATGRFIPGVESAANMADYYEMVTVKNGANNGVQLYERQRGAKRCRSRLSRI